MQIHLNYYLPEQQFLLLRYRYTVYIILVLGLTNQCPSTTTLQHTCPQRGSTARDSSNQAAMTRKDRSEAQIKEDNFIMLPSTLGLTAPLVTD